MKSDMYWKNKMDLTGPRSVISFETTMNDSDPVTVHNAVVIKGVNPAVREVAVDLTEAVTWVARDALTTTAMSVTAEAAVIDLLKAGC